MSTSTIPRSIAALLGSLVLAGLALGGPVAGHAYTIVDLGTLGGDSSEASAINAAGHVAGWSTNAAGATRAFLYRDGAMLDLGVLPGGSHSRATAIDDAGRVVGHGGINEHGPGFSEITQAFVWDSGAMQSLGALHCPCSFNIRYGTSEAHGINALGHVVGWSETVRGRAVTHAFRWTGAGMDDLGGGAGDWSVSRALAVNAAGQTVGDLAHATGPLAPPFDRRAAVWHGGGAPQDLGALPGHSSSQALAVSAGGRVVGWSGGIDGQGSRAVLWDGGAIRDLGTLPGDQSARARGVNSAGVVVGESRAPGGGSSRAFVWRDGEMRDLNTLIAGATGWTIVSARAVNDAGQIVGVGIREGQTRAVVLVDEAPSAPALAAAVLPSSRSVGVGKPATAFATIINPGSAQATGCGIAPMGPVSGAFTFQTTHPDTNLPTGTPDQPVDIPPGGRQTYVVALTPSSAGGPADIALRFQCAETAPAPVIVGVNTLLLVSSASPVPDVVMLAATHGGDGIVEVPSVGDSGAFAVATVNVGAGGSITVSADTGGAAVPVSLSLCETDPASGVCLGPLGPTVTRHIATGQTPTFGIFVAAHDAIAFAPGIHRVFVRAWDDSGTTRGATSVAVRTR